MLRHQMCHPEGACKLPQDDIPDVETCSSLIIYIFIVIVLSLVDLQIIRNAQYIYWN